MTYVANLRPASADLHPFFDLGSSTIEFRCPVAGAVVRVDVTSGTLRRRFGIHPGPYGLLQTYEANRVQIDAAVRARASGGGIGILNLRAQDLGNLSRVAAND